MFSTRKTEHPQNVVNGAGRQNERQGNEEMVEEGKEEVTEGKRVE